MLFVFPVEVVMYCQNRLIVQGIRPARPISDDELRDIIDRFKENFQKVPDMNNNDTTGILKNRTLLMPDVPSPLQALTPLSDNRGLPQCLSLFRAQPTWIANWSAPKKQRKSKQPQRASRKDRKARENDLVADGRLRSEARRVASGQLHIKRSRQERIEAAQDKAFASILHFHVLTPEEESKWATTFQAAKNHMKKEGITPAF